VFNIVQHASLNHRLECSGGVLAGECGALLRGFFLARR
jgi:tRNA(adenine34) deaminase